MIKSISPRHGSICGVTSAERTPGKLAHDKASGSCRDVLLLVLFVGVPIIGSEVGRIEAGRGEEFGRLIQGLERLHRIAAAAEATIERRRWSGVIGIEGIVTRLDLEIIVTELGRSSNLTIEV